MTLVHKSIPSKTRAQKHILLFTFFCSFLPPFHSSFLSPLRACLSPPGYVYLRSYMPKLFFLDRGRGTKKWPHNQKPEIENEENRLIFKTS